MYTSEIQFTIGFGLERIKIVAKNYTDLMNKVNNWIAKNSGKLITVLGLDSCVNIDKIIYRYPSGKTFIKKF